MAKNAESSEPQYAFLQQDDPVCLIIKAILKPVGDTDRFQPAGFPEVGHVIYDAPRSDERGNRFKEKVCIVDSPASMANHLETVCVAGPGSMELHSDLNHLPFVVCETDDRPPSETGKAADDRGNEEATKPPTRVGVVSTFTEGHRLASDYFLDSTTKDGKVFREVLRDEFKIVPIKKGETYFIPMETWWDIYRTIFKYDPNSLVHGVMFAKEQIKISRLLTAHLEAFGARRVGRSGVKFDRLGKTTSGQPIFSVDEETAHEIRATFIIDLAMLRSYGRGKNGLNDNQKKLLLDLALWKIKQLLGRPFRYRSQCFLGCDRVTIETESGAFAKTKQASDGAEIPMLPSLLSGVTIGESIKACGLANDKTTRVYYPADKLYKTSKDADQTGAVSDTDDKSGEGSNDEEV